MASNFSSMLYREKESLRDQIAEATIHWWNQMGVLSHIHDHYKVKEELMRCLQSIAAP